MKMFIATIIGSTAAFAITASADVPLAKSMVATFAFNTIDAPPFAITSTAEAAAFADYPLTWKKGETLTVEAPHGTVTAVATAAASSGFYAFAPTSGGVWKIASSEEGTTYVCVPWSVFGVGGLVCTSAPANVFAMDVLQSGPSRKSRDCIFPPIAYSGDDWGECSNVATSTLTITPPSEFGEAIALNSLIGTGVRPFSFDKTGKWTVSLAMSDGTTRTAVISVSEGCVISIR